MSVYDVAAVDRLNSLQNRNVKREERQTPYQSDSLPSYSHRRKYEGASSLRHIDKERRQPPDPPSLPTSPDRDKRSDTLKESLARHQASLSRRDSTFGAGDDLGGLNDDLPSLPRGFETGRDSTRHHRLENSSYYTPQLERRPHRRDGFYTVTATKTMTSSKTMTTAEPFEGGPAERMWDTLPTRRRHPEPAAEHVVRSREDLSLELRQNRYPYISSSTYSLPRNTRLMQANRKFSDTIRNSQESLLRTGQDLSFRESRESLLKRYPSSSLRSSPTPTRHPVPMYSQSASASRSHSPSSSPCSSPYCYSSARSSRNSSPHRSSRYHDGYYLNHPAYDHHHHHHPPPPPPPPPCCSSHHSSRNTSRSGSPQHHHYHVAPPGDCGGGGCHQQQQRYCNADSGHRSSRSSRCRSPELTYAAPSCCHGTAAFPVCGGGLGGHSHSGSPARSTRHSSCCPEESPPPLPPPCGGPLSPLLGRPGNEGSGCLSPRRDCTSPSQSCCSNKSRPRSPTTGHRHRGTPGCSQRSSRASSPLRTSSRRGSPTASIGPLDGVYRRILSPTSSEARGREAGAKSGVVAPVVMYVRETIQILNPQEVTNTAIPLDTLLRSLSVGSSQALIRQPDEDQETTEVMGGGQEVREVREVREVTGGGQDKDSDLRNSREDGSVKNITKAAEVDGLSATADAANAEAASLGAIPKTVATEAGPPLSDLSEILEAKVNQARSNRKSLSHMSLDQVDRASIEKFLASLRQCNTTGGEGVGPEEATVTMDNDDLDDSARAESIVSMTSTNSNRSRGHRHREYGEEEEEDGDTHSAIRRQSVIIEGLTMETDELRRKVMNLEEELVSVPFVQEVQQKLQVVETKLEETESFCYQVVEENVGLKSEIEALEAEISEVQDTFREKDAKEFKRVKWELENLAKTCRNLQLKLSKAQSKANRLRQEKEQLEEAQTDSSFLRTTVVFAAALLAGIHILAGKLKH